jgi:O-antigen/teichoic acid export membrane protein
MADSPVATVMKNLRNPLYRNGYALILSTVSTSGLGLLYWTLAARLYTPEIVGANSAILSAMMFLSGGTLFGLNNALVRFLPVAGKKTMRLIALSYGVSVLFALLVGGAFLIGMHLWASSLAPILADPFLAISFLVATAGTSIFNLQDNVLTGLRQAVWVPVENIMFSITKIIFLLLFMNLYRDYGVLFSWTLPVLLTLLPVNWLIFRRLAPHNVKHTEEDLALLSTQPFLKYLTGNYASSLFFLAYTTLPPLLVTRLLGAAANAYFYLPWTITSSLFLVAVNMTTSMTVEAAKDQKNLRKYSISIFTHTLKLIGPIVLIILAGADLFLQIFGKNYAQEGAMLVRLLVTAAIPHLIISIFLSRWRIQNRIKNIVLMQAGLCSLILGLSFIFLPIMGIKGVGLAWLFSYTLIAILLIIPQALHIFQTDRNHKKVSGT